MDCFERRAPVEAAAARPPSLCFDEASRAALQFRREKFSKRCIEFHEQPSIVRFDLKSSK
jgi:hypothetical protein